MVFGHPAGLIHEYPNEAILFLRARRARSSRSREDSMFPEMEDDARPFGVLVPLRRAPPCVSPADEWCCEEAR